MLSQDRFKLFLDLVYVKHSEYICLIFVWFLLLYSILGVPDSAKPVDHGTLTISGLHLTVVPFTKMSFFTDKKEIQRSSTALGYVAHVCCFHTI